MQPELGPPGSVKSLMPSPAGEVVILKGEESICVFACTPKHQCWEDYDVIVWQLYVALFILVHTTVCCRAVQLGEQNKQL